MSKKKVLDYDPKTGFGNFAEIMNKNYALAMARNGVNMPANNMAGAPLESGTLGGTQAQSGMLKVDTAAPSLAEAAVVTEDPVATDTETGTVTDTDASTGANTGAVSGVTSDLTGSTAQPILSVSGYKSNIGTYDEWMAKNGYDPDRDYDEKKAALEYDYKTSSATYGRRAEELSQMGLSNSGLSDIYQLGEFNSYLQQQRQIANERIAAKKKYKQEYNTLYQQNLDALKLDNANAYNLGLSLYDGENIDFVRQQLTQQGYDASVVEQAVQSLAALDVNTLPVVKKQNAARDAKIQNAVENWLQTGYNSNDADSVRALYDKQDWDKADIEKLISQLDAYSATTTDALVEEGLAAFYAANPDFVYDGTAKAKEQIKQSLGDKYKDVYDKIFNKMDADRNALEEAPGKDFIDGVTITEGQNGEDDTVTVDESKVGGMQMTDGVINALKDMIKKDDENGSNEKKIQAKFDAEIDNVLSSDTKLEDLYNFVGYDQAAWDELSEEDQSDAVTNAVFKYYSMGFVTNDKFKTYYQNTISDTFKESRQNNYADTTDENNHYSLGFIRDVSNTAIYYMDMKANGYIDDNDYYNIMSYMYSELDKDEKQGLYRNMFIQSKGQGGIQDELNWGGQALADGWAAMSDVVGNITVVPALVRNAVGSVSGTVSEDQLSDHLGGIESDQRDALGEIYYAEFRKQKNNGVDDPDVAKGSWLPEDSAFGWKPYAVFNACLARYEHEKNNQTEEVKE